MIAPRTPAIWFPAVRAGTGADVFTKRLVQALNKRGISAEITWLPLRAEYAPWSVRAPSPPPWANVAHINTWLHPRFFSGSDLRIVATNHGCVHDPALRPYKSPAQALYHGFWIRRLEARNLAIADCVTAVSRYTAARLKDAFGHQKIEVVSNWVPDDAFVAPKPRATPQQPFRLLYVGTWSRRKGVDLLPQILDHLGAAFELWFTARSSVNTPLPPNMVAIPWTSSATEVRRRMEEADALLFPSRMEGLPLAVLEALACGLPVITTATASLPEVIEHGHNGLLCPIDDVVAFASAARWLAEHPRVWCGMRWNAIATARTRHSERAAVDTYLRLYHRTVKEPA